VSKLWITGTDRTNSTWLVVKKARQPLADVLGRALGDRFDNRREPKHE
jgi:hypothetical protein